MLREALKDLPSDAIVVVEINDGEGNNTVIDSENFKLNVPENFCVVVDHNEQVEVEDYDDFTLYHLDIVSVEEDLNGVHFKPFVVIELVGPSTHGDD